MSGEPLKDCKQEQHNLRRSFGLTEEYGLKVGETNELIIQEATTGAG